MYAVRGRSIWIGLDDLNDDDGPEIRPDAVLTLRRDVNRFALRRHDDTPPVAAGTRVMVLETRPYGDDMLCAEMIFVDADPPREVTA